MNKEDHGRHRIAIKPYSCRELAELYGVCKQTFRSWIAPFKIEIGLRIGRFYTVRQVEIIFEKLGLPSVIDND